MIPLLQGIQFASSILRYVRFYLASGLNNRQIFWNMNAMSSIYVRIWIFRDKFPVFRGGRQSELSFVLL